MTMSAENSDMQAVLGYEDCVRRYKDAITKEAINKKARRNLIQEAARVANLFPNGKEKNTLLDIASGKW